MHMNKNTYNPIIEATSFLPDKLMLKLYDAWRPYDVQKPLYDKYYCIVKNNPCNIGKAEEELLEIICHFVSFPTINPNQPASHFTGGAVDLKIVDENGYELDMGPDFDDFTEKSHIAYFENSESHIKYNRRLFGITILKIYSEVFIPEENLSIKEYTSKCI